MTSPAVIPAYLVRQYIWAVLKANEPNDWKESNYGGKIPVVPLGEDSDLEQYPHPTIVYQFSDLRTGTMWMRGRGAMSFAIRDTNLRRITRAVTVITQALNRYDESARDVNEFLGEMGSPWNSIGFGEFHVTFADGGAPAEVEGGEMVAVVSIEFSYFSEYENEPDPLITRPNHR